MSVREVRSFRCLALLCFRSDRKCGHLAEGPLRIAPFFTRQQRFQTPKAQNRHFGTHRYAEVSAAPHICMYLDRSRTVALYIARCVMHSCSHRHTTCFCLAAQALMAGGSCSRWRQMGLRGTPPPFTSITGRAVSPATRVVAHASERARAGPR